MDVNNLSNIEEIRPKNSKTSIRLLLKFSSMVNKNLPDPYYTNDFETVATLIENSCENFLNQYFK